MTYAAEQARDYNLPIWFVHIEGFPYLWFTKVPSDWSEPSGWDYRSGLSLAEFSLSQNIDPLVGVADAETVSLQIYDDLLLTLFATQRQTKNNWSYLVTNNVAAGVNGNLVVSRAMSDAAASNGTIYIGNQTITYASYSGTTFTTVDRGRYAILDSALAEVKWCPRIKWNDDLDVPPLVTVLPRTVEGRVITLYRTYTDLAGDTLAKAQSQVRWRGTISAYGLTEDCLGYSISAISILDLLKREIAADVGEHDVKGYSLPTNVYGANLAGTKKVYLNIRESLWYLYGTTVSAWKIKEDTTKDRAIYIGNVIYFDDIDEIIQEINSALKTAFTAGNLYAPWFCKRGKGNRVELGYHTVGYDNSAPPVIIAQGGTDTFAYGVYGRLYSDGLTAALGFGNADRKLFQVTNYNGAGYRHMFATNTNKSHYASMLDSDLGAYYPVALRANNEACQTWFWLDNTFTIPLDLPDASHDFSEDPPDGGEFLVKVNDDIIYRATHVDLVPDDLYLKNAAQDYRNPIRTKTAPDDKFIKVSEKAKAIDIPTVKQVIMPMGGHRYQIGSSPDVYLIRWAINHSIVHFWCSTGSTGYNGDFDIYPAGWGLGLPEEYIDGDSFIAIGDLYDEAALRRRYLIHKAMPLMDIVEAETKVLDFIITMQEGKITARPVSDPADIKSVLTIDISVRTELKPEWQSNIEGVINHIVLGVDHDWKDDEYRDTEEFIDLGSQTDLKIVGTFELENKGIEGEIFGGKQIRTLDEINMLMADRLSRMAKESYLYRCEVNRKAENLVIGDVVRVTDARIPNPVSGERGISNAVGIVQSFEWNEKTNRGDIMIALFYFPVATFATTFDAWWKGSLALAMNVVSKSGNEIIVDNNYWIQNGTPGVFSTGEMIQITDMETGDTFDVTVASYDSATGKIIGESDVDYSYIDPKQMIVTYQSYNKLGAATGNEKKAAYLSNQDGLLNATDQGCNYT